MARVMTPFAMALLLAGCGGTPTTPASSPVAQPCRRVEATWVHLATRFGADDPRAGHLDQVARAFSSRGAETARLRVEVHPLCDPADPSETLSLASAVATELVARGVPLERIATVAYGTQGAYSGCGVCPCLPDDQKAQGKCTMRCGGPTHRRGEVSIEFSLLHERCVDPGPSR